jgi:alanine racemase
VILVDASEGVSITVEDLALWAGTIPYEILTNINTRVPRVFVER